MANIFSQRKKRLDGLLGARQKKQAAPPGQELYIKCDGCMAEHPRHALEQHDYICPRCGQHLRMPAKSRLAMVFDGGQYKERFTHVKTKNPIDFPDYEEKLRQQRQASGLADACVAGVGSIGGIRAVCAALDSRFLMGSMGVAVGEKITLAAEYARVNKLPLVVFSASGGARMQEGMFSLMQMAKTAAAVRMLSDAGGLYISVITHPTTGGVTASFASLGDIILAEPDALFGFAGPRVIEQTIGQRLPQGFQRSEFQQQHGFVDAIVPRSALRQTLVQLLALHKR